MSDNLRNGHRVCLIHRIALTSGGPAWIGLREMWNPAEAL